MKDETQKNSPLAMAAAMALSITACGGGDESTPSGSQPSGSQPSGGGAVTLTVASFNIGGFTDSAAWEPIIEAFNAQNPDVTIEILPVTYQDGDQQLANLIAGGNAPDVVFEGPERIIGNYANEGLLVDLSDLWEGVTDIPESISSVSQLDGTYYMYPLSVAAHCMAINYEAFEAAGALQYIDEETRTWTTDDFVAACEALKAAMDAGTITMAETGIIYSALRAATRAPALW